MKLSDKWFSGLPDVLMILDGRCLFYEVKANKGLVSKIQAQIHNRLRDAGAYVQVVREGDLN